MLAVTLVFLFVTLISIAPIAQQSPNPRSSPFASILYPYPFEEIRDQTVFIVSVVSIPEEIADKYSLSEMSIFVGYERLIVYPLQDKMIYDPMTKSYIGYYLSIWEPRSEGASLIWMRVTFSPNSNSLLPLFSDDLRFVIVNLQGEWQGENRKEASGTGKPEFDLGLMSVTSEYVIYPCPELCYEDYGLECVCPLPDDGTGGNEPPPPDDGEGGEEGDSGEEDDGGDGEEGDSGEEDNGEGGEEDNGEGGGCSGISYYSPAPYISGRIVQPLGKEIFVTAGETLTLEAYGSPNPDKDKRVKRSYNPDSQSCSSSESEVGGPNLSFIWRLWKDDGDGKFERGKDTLMWRRYGRQIQWQAPSELGTYWIELVVDDDGNPDYDALGTVKKCGKCSVTSNSDDPAVRDWLKVKVRVAKVDLDIDSDNNDGLNLPDRSEIEEEMEDVSGDDFRPGKVILVNDVDYDDDGIVDWADGFDLYEFLPDDDISPNSKFVPIILEIANIDFANAKVHIKYDASDPSLITPSFNTAYVLPPGKLRIWRKDGYEVRNKLPLNQGGDFIAPGVYSPAQLGLSPTNTKVILFVEAIRESNQTADPTILVEVDPTGNKGYILNVYVERHTNKILSIGAPPVGYSPDQWTEVDVIYLKKGYRPKTDDILDPNQIEDIYEIKTSAILNISNPRLQFQISRLKEIRRGDIKIIRPKWRWSPQGWYENPRYTAGTIILGGIAALETVQKVIAIINYSEHEKEFEEILVTARDIARREESPYQRMLSVIDELLPKMRQYLSHFLPQYLNNSIFLSKCYAILRTGDWGVDIKMQYGYLTFYTIQKPKNPKKWILQLCKLSGATHAEFVRRSKEEDRGWEEFVMGEERGMEVVAEYEGIQIIMPRFNEYWEDLGQNVLIENIPDFYVEGLVLHITIGACPLGRKIMKSVEEKIPFEIRGVFMPWDMSITIGYHDIIDEIEGYFVARAFCEISFASQSTPNNCQLFSDLVFKLPEVQEVKKDLEKVTGPLEQYIIWSV